MFWKKRSPEEVLDRRISFFLRHFIDSTYDLVVQTSAGLFRLRDHHNLDAVLRSHITGDAPAIEVNTTEGPMTLRGPFVVGVFRPLFRHRDSSECRYQGDKK
jgi:hypothetical protein